MRSKTSDQHQAPEHLSQEAGEWYERLSREYDIQDSGGKLLLLSAMESFDRMRHCQEVIDAEGAVLTDRFGQRKSHPLTSPCREHKAQMLQSLKMLNLDIEPAKLPGRPGKQW